MAFKFRKSSKENFEIDTGFDDTDEIIEKPQEEIGKIGELLRKKEMCLDIGCIDLIRKLSDYIQEELFLTEIGLKKLKISNERINTIRLQYLGNNIANYFDFLASR